jgi:hypothetical protein
MKVLTLPPNARLRSLLEYDADTGFFKWKRTGKIAGTKNSRGYVSIYVDGTLYRAHRLAFVYSHGDVLSSIDEIDHINGDPSDNRIVNLRISTRSQNNGNSRGWGTKRKHRLRKGVHPSGNKYTAYIMQDRSKRYLGTFNTENDAHAAYVAAAKNLFGVFART